MDPSKEDKKWAGNSVCKVSWRPYLTGRELVFLMKIVKGELESWSRWGESFWMIRRMVRDWRVETYGFLRDMRIQSYFTNLQTTERMLIRFRRCKELMVLQQQVLRILHSLEFVTLMFEGMFKEESRSTIAEVVTMAFSFPVLWEKRIMSNS